MLSGPGDLLVSSELTFSPTDCDEIVVSMSGGGSSKISIAFWHSLFLGSGSALASFSPTNAKCEFIRRTFSSSVTTRLPSLSVLSFLLLILTCLSFSKPLLRCMYVVIY